MLSSLTNVFIINGNNYTRSTRQTNAIRDFSTLMYFIIIFYTTMCFIYWSFFLILFFKSSFCYITVTCLINWTQLRLKYFFHYICMCHKKYSIFSNFFYFSYIYSTEHTKFSFSRFFLFFIPFACLTRELSYTRRRWRWEFTILIIIYFTWNHTFNARNQTRLNLSLALDVKKYKSFTQMSLLSPYAQSHRRKFLFWKSFFLSRKK